MNKFLQDLESTIPDLDSNLDSPVNAADADIGSAANTRGQLTTAADASRYMLAGKSTVTLASVKTGAHFTFRITQSEDGLAHFVGVLSGPDNTADYRYLGRISRGIFWAGRKVPRPGDIARDAPSARAFDWAWRQLARSELPDTLEIWHESYCGRCGHKLTVPASVSRGYGPECAAKVMG